MELIRLTQNYVESNIYQDEWEEALILALKKLDIIIKKQGDANGKRLEMWYLAQLIAEEIKSNRMMTETLITMEAKRKAHDIMTVSNSRIQHASIVPVNN